MATGEALTQREQQGLEHMRKAQELGVTLKEYAARLVLATHPEGEYAPSVTGKYVRCGASPRGAQALLPGRPCPPWTSDCLDCSGGISREDWCPR